MRRTHFIRLFALCVLVLGVAPSVASTAELMVTQGVGETTLQLNNDAPFYSTARAVRSARVIPVDPCRERVYWTERNPPRIRRAGFDGLQIEDLVTTGLELPYGITLELPYYALNETPKCIPALSGVGTIAFAMLLFCSAWVVLRRRH